MTFRKRGFRAMVLGLLVAAGLALTPAAFARGHIGIAIGVPGVSVGYGPYGVVGVGGYYGGYYAPAYYDPYYYAPYPAYGVVYGGPRYYPHNYYRGGYYYRGRGHDYRGYHH